MGGAFNRLTATDLMFLRLETPDWPCHFGGLILLDGAPLCDGAGELRLDEIRRRLDGRLTHIPDLRQKVHFPGPLGGGPIWVDEGQFAIERHVHAAAVPRGGEGFLDAVSEIYMRPLDRNLPLWDIWFLTGLEDGRVGMLFRLHHAVADGLAAMAIVASLFDLDPDAEDPVAAPMRQEQIPTRRELIVDNLTARARAVGRRVRAALHPARLFASLGSFGRMTRGYFGSRAAAASSLNEVVGEGRRVAWLRLDLAVMKRVAHAHEGKVNDVVLALWSAGVRSLLKSRNEPVEDVDLVTGMATTLRPSTGAGETIDNRVGTMMLRLPLSAAAIGERLADTARHTAETKAVWNPAATMGYLAALAGTPIGRYFVANQTASNTIVTNVIGPPQPVYFLGAPVHEIIPIIELVGNIGLTLCAFSYAGEMFLVVTADAGSFPDLDVLMAGMDRDWKALVLDLDSE